MPLTLLPGFLHAQLIVTPGHCLELQRWWRRINALPFCASSEQPTDPSMISSEARRLPQGFLKVGLLGLGVTLLSRQALFPSRF